MIPPLFAPPGLPFIMAGVAFVLVCWFVGWRALGSLGILGTAFFAYFFRDPERVIPQEDAVIVSPADGKVILRDEVWEEQFLQAAAQRLAIFMNVFDVHVNRAPVAGTVAEVSHRPGGFQAAFRQEADRQNEQRATLLEARDGRRVLVVQIAGLLARRIIPYVKKGDHLAKGERLGMICFGSRVDLYLPRDCEITVRLGEHLKGGSSIVGRWA